MIGWLRRAAQGYARPSDPSPAEARRVVLLEWEPNPSSDHLLLPWLARQGRTPVKQRTDAPDLMDGDLVVIVRYLAPAARGAIEAMAGRQAAASQRSSSMK
jgi:hypothetical protein